MLVVLLCLIVLVYGGRLLNFITKDADIWLILRWPIAFVLFFLMLSYNYYELPTEKVAYKAVLPGSLFAAVGMLIVTAIYSQYIGSVANYNILYGALANIVALMFWFFFLAWVLMLGVLFNKVWNDTSTEPFHRKDILKIHKKKKRPNEGDLYYDPDGDYEDTDIYEGQSEEKTETSTEKTQ